MNYKNKLRTGGAEMRRGRGGVSEAGGKPGRKTIKRKKKMENYY